MCTQCLLPSSQLRRKLLSGLDTAQQQTAAFVTFAFEIHPALTTQVRESPKVTSISPSGAAQPLSLRVHRVLDEGERFILKSHIAVLFQRRSSYRVREGYSLGWSSVITVLMHGS